MRVVSPSCTPVGSPSGYPSEWAVSVVFLTVFRLSAACCAPSGAFRRVRAGPVDPAWRVHARRVHARPGRDAHQTWRASGPDPARIQAGSGPVQASPSRSAAVAASTETVTGCGAPATAQSGSLRPFPVTVQTMR